MPHQTKTKLAQRIKSKILISVIGGILFYAIFAIISDAEKLGTAFATFNWIYIPLILFLTFLNYLLRFIKWHYFLNHLKIKFNIKSSARIFFSGLSMSITPAKMGEAFKSYLLKEEKGIAVSRTVMVVFAERLTDLIGMLILAAIGLSIFPDAQLAILFLFIIIAFFIVAIKSEKLYSFFASLSFLKRFSKSFFNLHKTSHELLEMKPLILSITISIISWFFECLALFFVLKGFGIDITVLLSMFVFSFSSVAGSVSMIPGGLGVAEGGMAGLLVLNGIMGSIAVASTLIIRLCTLWFGVLVGMGVLFLHNIRKR